MTLATPYGHYTGYHDAKSYPNAAEAQGKLILPIDIYNHDLDFLSYADKYVFSYTSAVLYKPLTQVPASTLSTVIFQATIAAHHRR